MMSLAFVKMLECSLSCSSHEKIDLGISKIKLPITKYESIVTFPHMLSFWPRWSVAGSLPRVFFLTATCSSFGVCVWRPRDAANFRLRLLFLQPLGWEGCGAGSSFVLEWGACDPKGSVSRADSASVDFFQVRFPRETKKYKQWVFLGFSKLVSHIAVAPPFGQSRWHLAAQPPTNPESTCFAASTLESEAKNFGTFLGGTKDRLGRYVWSVRCELVRQARVPASNSGESGECQAIIFSAHQRRHPVWKASLEPTEQLFADVSPRSCLMPIASRVDSISVLHSATERFWRRVLVNMLLSSPKQGPTV